MVLVEMPLKLVDESNIPICAKSKEFLWHFGNFKLNSRKFLVNNSGNLVGLLLSDLLSTTPTGRCNKNNGFYKKRAVASQSQSLCSNCDTARFAPRVNAHVWKVQLWTQYQLSWWRCTMCAGAKLSLCAAAPSHSPVTCHLCPLYSLLR